MLTVDYIARRSATLYRDRRALVFEGRQWTYGELNARMNRAGAAWVALGLGRQERLAMLMANRPEVIETQFGAYKHARCLVPLNARLSVEEHAHMLTETDARVLVYSAEFRDHVDQLRSKVPVEHYVCVGEPSGGDLGYEALLAEQPEDEPDAAVQPEEMASLNYTSGTTGKLKAAILPHRVWAQVVVNQVANLPTIGVDDVMLHCAPLTHASGAVFSAFFAQGATNVILPGFDPVGFLDAVPAHRATTLFLVPTMIVVLLSVPGVEERDFSSVRTILYGASPMPVEPLRRALELWGPKLVQAYGQTEAPLMSTMLAHDDHVTGGDPIREARLASAGRPIVGVEVRVVDDEGRDVAPGEIGEIVSRGHHTMAGYWKAPEATAETIRDGWVHSRDLATVDADGYVFVVDRTSDMIISGGFNVYPREIEEVLYEHPKVFEAAVIGVPDERWGEAIKACVVLVEGEQVTAEELIAFCRERLASYKKPTSVDFVAELPKNPYGKVLRRSLREPYWVGHERKV